MTTAAFPGVAYPGVTYPGDATGSPAVDTLPQDHLRVEVAFTTEPDDAIPAWVDLTPRLDLMPGVTISRGRPNEHDAVSPGKLSLTLNNTDGALTADRAASPYYPNVKVARRIRVTYRDPADVGTKNMIPAESASFEGGTVGSWVTTYFGTPAAVTLANSTTHPSSGTKGMLITWPTAAAGCSPSLFVNVVKGRTYTARCVVWIPAGSPAVKFGSIFGAGTVNSTTTGAFETLAVTFTADSSGMYLGLRTLTASTAGQQCWVDSVMIDEGSSLGAFTTNGPTLSYRYDGYVDEWPTEWPGGVDTYSSASITASDVLARIGARKKLGSVIEETALLDGPSFYYVLGEAADSTTVGDATTGDNSLVLHVEQVGVGGDITFASGTGPPTDGRSAPVFAPVDVSNGRRITGRVPPLGPFQGTGGVSLGLAFNTSTSAVQTIGRLSDTYGTTFVDLSVTAAGKLQATFYNTWKQATALATVTSAASVVDGATHSGMVTLSTGATTTMTLVLDGASAGTGTFAKELYEFAFLDIGGTQSGRMFTGTISHVAGYASTLTVAQAAEHRSAQTTGFAGERSDQRIARIARWAGVPTSRQLLDVGMSTSVAHIDCTGKGALEYMRLVEVTEGGLLYADGEGTLVFRSRADRYTPKAPDLVLTSPDLLGRGTRVVKDLQLVVNDITGSRPGGASVRVFDAASIASYGTLATSVELLTTSDNEVADAVNWRLQGQSSPVVRFPSLELDAFTDPANGAALRALDLLSYVQVAGMPAQAPAATINQVIQGFSESISATGWSLTANTSNYGTARALVLDHATYGKTDDLNVLAY